MTYRLFWWFYFIGSTTSFFAPKIHSAIRNCNRNQPIGSHHSIVDSLLFKEAALLETEGFVDDAITAFKNISLTWKSKDTNRIELAYIELRLAHLENDGRGDLQKAESHLQKALILDPVPSPTVLDQLGCVLATKMRSDAETVFKRASDALPKDPHSESLSGPHFHLAVQRDLKYTSLSSTSQQNSFNCVGLPSHMISSWQYAKLQFPQALLATGQLYNGTRSVLAAAVACATPLIQSHMVGASSLVLEFGVSYGKSIRMLADLTSEIEGGENVLIAGFDTFTGLPEAWGSEAAGTYSTGGLLPPVPAGVQLVQGLFADTLGPFLDRIGSEQSDDLLPRPVALVNIDCDLYQGTADILHELGSRSGLIVPGTVLVFDEYFMYEGWQDHEFKAFQEACSKFGWSYEYVAWSLASKQVVVQITAVGIGNPS